MEQGILETEEERYVRRHNRYLKDREQGKNWAFHKDAKGKKVRPKYIKIEELPEEKRERYRERRHRSYLKARAEGKSWANHGTRKILSDEEKKRRNAYSKKYKAEHPAQTKENMRRWRAEHGEEEKRSWQEYRRNNKKLAIEYLGGKCSMCGGVFHPDVYDFHHKDADEKDVCVGKLLTRKFERITPELDKCILLCANCHRIKHAQY